MEHSPVGMALVALDGEFLNVNVALCEMLGYEPQQLTGLTFQDITHPDDLASDMRLVLRALADEISSYRITKRYIRSDGGVVIGDLSVALLRAPDGTPIHFISQIVDLTERHAFAERLEAAERAIESEQRKVDAVFDSVAVGLLLLDKDGSYQGYNARHQTYMDLAFPGGHHGRVGQVGFLYDAEQRRPLRSEEMPTTRAAAGEEFDDLLIWVGEEPQTRRAVSVSARSVRDRLGRTTGAALAYHDVTDLVRAITARDEFVASISHELRTPLTAAMAYLELLEDSSDVSDDVRRQVTAVQRNVTRLSHLVADLLFATRVDSGSTLIDPYSIDMVNVVKEGLEAAGANAANAGVTLVAEVPASLVVVADGLRLRQVVDNLLGNAIAYSPQGGFVTVRLTSTDASVELTVFKRFHRGQNALRRRVPGTGLGLNIVRTIVEAHGGEVSLTSTEGRGTTVRVVLPC
jgi:PAS domain S-box-containing protein